MARSLYDRLAGRARDRMGSLSDGVFAFAITLLVLDIRPPPIAQVHGEAQLVAAIADLAPRFVTYLMSFLTLGIFWLAQQTQLSLFERTDRDLSWLQLALLAGVALMPFSTSLLAQFITFRAALLIYWANILYEGVLLYLAWAYADRAGLVRRDAPEGVSRAVRRRIVFAQSLYALGALLCLLSTYASIAFIVLVQLYFAVAPSAPRRARRPRITA